MMKFRGPIFLSLIVIALLIGAYSPAPYVDNAEKEAVLMQTILNGLEQWHYQPQAIDDNFSKKVYDLYLNRLDGGRRWLTQPDIDKLAKYELALDDEAKAGTYEFFDLATELKAAGIRKTKAYYQELLAQPFDFTVKEMVELDNDKKPFAKNDAELKDYWRKSLKFETLTRLNDKLEAQKKLQEKAAEKQAESSEEIPAVEIKTYEQLEAEARADVLKLYNRWYDRMEKQKRMDHISEYLDVISNVFDPHSGYFEPVEKQSFDIGFSGRWEGIGAALLEDGDFTKVSEIIVGGPAWRGKELEENDVIMKVAQTGEEPVDIKGMQLKEVVQLIRGKKGTEVVLTVKKVDGTMKNVKIIRDVVVREEQFAKSLLLDGAGEKEKIGYIFLPSFYADFNDPKGHFSAKDVAIEIEKLKQDNVNGIILDLRGNPGGSLSEVVKMAGLFIEDGPIVQVKARNMEPEVLEDVDPKVHYNGPLVVLVNGFSASASEIMAAALQDYERAVIVGTPTFGKGTVQRFLDLDRTLRGYAEFKPLGEIKLTIQKYYRINGGSVQLRGVTPDIVLPDSYQFLETGERYYDHAMEWSEIPSVKFSQNVVRLNNLNDLEASSKARVSQDETFQKVEQRAKMLKTQRDQSAYPLNLQAYQTLQEKREAEAKVFENMLDKEVLPGAVRNLTADKANLEQADESKIARNEDFIKSVKKDIYLREALNILHDMLKPNPKYSERRAKQ